MLSRMSPARPVFAGDVRSFQMDADHSVSDRLRFVARGGDGSHRVQLHFKTVRRDRGAVTHHAALVLRSVIFSTSVGVSEGSLNS